MTTESKYKYMSVALSQDLFNKKSKYSETNWAAVCRKAICRYLKYLKGEAERPDFLNEIDPNKQKNKKES